MSCLPSAFWLLEGSDNQNALEKNLATVFEGKIDVVQIVGPPTLKYHVTSSPRPSHLSACNT